LKGQFQNYLMILFSQRISLSTFQLITMSSPLTQQLSAAPMPGRIQRQDTVHLQKPTPEMVPVPLPVPVNPKTRLELKETDWTSIYIPQIPDTLYLDGMIGREEDGTTPMHEFVLEWLVQTNLELGQVSRIDYVTRQSVGNAPPTKSAFVHMSYWNDTPHVRNFRQTLETKGAWKLASAIDKTRNNKVLQIMDTVGGKPVPRYLSLKINVAPIPTADASLNVHQLATAKAALEQQVANLTEAYKKLEAKSNLSNQLIAELKDVKNDAFELEICLARMLDRVRPDLSRTFNRHYHHAFSFTMPGDEDSDNDDVEYDDAHPEPNGSNDDEEDEDTQYVGAEAIV